MEHSEIDLLILKSVGGVTTQQSIASEIGYSVGKVNFVLKELVKKGLVKAEKFATAENKNKYRYLLTEQGFKEKVALTEKFIQRKKAEYDKLQAELEEYKSQNHNGFISQGIAN